ncbi:hypothetical protein C3F09_04835, partial [candidate division GN15 bacterium]
MNRALLLGVFCILILAPTVAPGQELSTDVFPSEDELLEALIAGDIDYDQYILLLDIAQHGVDTANLYLLDLVPNLSSLTDRAGQSGLETDQQELFVRRAGARPSRVRYLYYRTLDTKEQFRYRLDSRVRVSDSWRAEFGIRRELSGRERFVGRSLIYQTDSGLVRKVAFGSVTERYGLGSVIGYRGKLLRYSDELDAESFFCPDNGNFNGVSADLRMPTWQIRSMASYVRDTSLALSTFALMAEPTAGVIRPYAVFGGNRLRNRATGGKIDDFKLAGGIVLRDARHYVAAEYCAQTVSGRESGTLLFEGAHGLRRIRLEYAGWWYGDNYLDLTSGGKAAGISTRIDLPEVDFALTSKRPGQRGGRLSVRTDLGPATRLFGSAIYARRNADSGNFQWLEGLERELTKQLSVRIDYLHSSKDRNTVDEADTRFNRRVRAETRFITDKVRLRT